MICFVLHQHVPYWKYFVAIMKAPIRKGREIFGTPCMLQCQTARSRKLTIAECLFFITENACDSLAVHSQNYVIKLMGSPLIIWGRQKRIVDFGTQTHSSVLYLQVRLLIYVGFKHKLKICKFMLFIPCILLQPLLKFYTK